MNTRERALERTGRALLAWAEAVQAEAQRRAVDGGCDVFLIEPAELVAMRAAIALPPEGPAPGDTIAVADLGRRRVKIMRRRSGASCNGWGTWTKGNEPAPKHRIAEGELYVTIGIDGEDDACCLRCVGYGPALVAVDGGKQS